jgi:probable non-F420 flavinoid oxidoreductase
VTVFGYHASHEQHSPKQLLEYVQLAERAGFAVGMCSDHFHPWTPKQGQSGFAWSWLGAALQATSLSFGCVNAPGWRYHPALIAQAAATLAEMFPGRFWIAVGSGEALNEHITGEPWPEKPERNERLLECVQVIRALWSGQTVTHHGRIVVEDAKLYTRPVRPPLIFGAALTPQTARWIGSWADGMITVSMPDEEFRAMLYAFREGGGAGKPVKVQASLAWAPTDSEARAAAHQQWAGNLVGKEQLATLRMPEDFEAASLTLEEVCSQLPVSSNPQVHLRELHRYVELDVDEVYVFNVTPYQREFIEIFGEHVLPALSKSDNR